MTWIKEKAAWFMNIQAMPSHDLCDLVYIFITGGFIGTLYEVILTLAFHGMLEDRSGSVLTPVNYVYGFGAAVFVLLWRMKKPLHIFVLGAVLGGAVEYCLSLFQEYVMGCRSWDYSARPLNINGRTTVPYMLVWGILCYLAIRFVFPALLRLMHRVPPRMRKRLAAAFVVIMAVDAVVTLVAIVRYSQRAGGVFFSDPLLNMVDRVFNDTFMERHFPNMILG